MAASDRGLIAAVRTGIAAVADPARAPRMRAYMKSALPYAGVPTPPLRAVSRTAFADHPLASAAAFEATVRALFDEASVREEWYAAVDLARHPSYAAYSTPDRWPLYRHLITASAWWDVVDEVAGNLVGPLLLAHPEAMTPLLVDCIDDEHLWLRRTSIICQLGAQGRTDLDLLTHAIDTNLDDGDFFIRKAIGWALRQYARTDPKWVGRFVAERTDRLSGLSRREALKHL